MRKFLMLIAVLFFVHAYGQECRYQVGLYSGFWSSKKYSFIEGQRSDFNQLHDYGVLMKFCRNKRFQFQMELDYRRGSSYVVYSYVNSQGYQTVTNEKAILNMGALNLKFNWVLVYKGNWKVSIYNGVGLGGYQRKLASLDSYIVKENGIQDTTAYNTYSGLDGFSNSTMIGVMAEYQFYPKFSVFGDLSASQLTAFHNILDAELLLVPNVRFGINYCF